MNADEEVMVENFINDIDRIIEKVKELKKVIRNDALEEAAEISLLGGSPLIAYCIRVLKE